MSRRAAPGRILHSSFLEWAWMEGMGEEAEIEAVDKEVPGEFCWVSLMAPPPHRPAPFSSSRHWDTGRPEKGSKGMKQSAGRSLCPVPNHHESWYPKADSLHLGRAAVEAGSVAVDPPESWIMVSFWRGPEATEQITDLLLLVTLAIPSQIWIPDKASGKHAANQLSKRKNRMET